MSGQVVGYKKLLKAYEASCRVDAKQARGSCTIIYSKNKETFALTNFHVIERNLSYKEVFDSLLQKDVKNEYKEHVEVLFPRMSGDRVSGHSTVLADIILYERQQDIALLKFRDKNEYPYAEFYPEDTCKDVPMLSTLACIGAALGQKPIATFGHLNGVQIEIDNFEYWMSSAPSIFGNSGGGIFVLDDEQKWLFLGIPSRISVVPMGFTANAVTHMGYFIPLFRIYDWLEENCYQFLYNDEFTSEECDEMRQEKIEEDLIKLLAKKKM